MNAFVPPITCRILLLGLLPFWMGGAEAVSTDTEIPIDERGRSSLSAETEFQSARSYASHYLVFGARDDAGRPRIVAIDFNRTAEADSVAYEYTDPCTDR